MSFTMLMLPPPSELSAACARAVRDAVPGSQVIEAADPAEAAAAIGSADAAFGTLGRELLQGAHRLRWLQAPAAAPPAGFFYPELTAHPVTVTNLRGTYADHVAAHGLAFVLAFARGLDCYHSQQAVGVWRPDQGRFVHLPESTVLLVGVGAIGEELTRLLAPFAAHVVGIDARRREPPPGMAEIHPPGQLDQLLPAADFVILTIPHTPQTAGLIDRRRLRQMKPSAFLINIGRGATVRLDDLTAALAAGEVAGAGLDVFEREPLPPGHPLWTAERVLITPHVAGIGPHVRERRAALVAENARRFAVGRELCCVVDKASWY